MEFIAHPGAVLLSQSGFMEVCASPLAYTPALTAFAGLTGVANRVPYFTGAAAMALKPFGTAGDAIPLLNGANTWSASQTFAAAAAFQGTSVNLDYYETDGGADTKRWRDVYNGNVYAFQMVNDLYAAATTVLSVSRTAHTAAVLAIPATTKLQLSNNNALVGRNAANSNDVSLISVNASDRVAVAGEERIPWTSWTPTVSTQGGALESSTIVSARYRKEGRTVFFAVAVRTKNDGTGTGTGYVQITTPITAVQVSACSGYNSLDGHAIRAEITTGGAIRLLRTNGNSPVRNPADTANIDTYLVFAGHYEVAA